MSLGHEARLADLPTIRATSSRRGFNTTNSVSISGGTERNQTYFSAASLNSRGTIPNNVSQPL